MKILLSQTEKRFLAESRLWDRLRFWGSRSAVALILLLAAAACLFWFSAQKEAAAANEARIVAQTEATNAYHAKVAAQTEATNAQNAKVAAQSALAKYYARAFVWPESAWELAQLAPANDIVRDKVLAEWFETSGSLETALSHRGALRALAGLSPQRHDLITGGAARLAEESLRLLPLPTTSVRTQLDYNTYRVWSQPQFWSFVAAALKPDQAAKEGRELVERLEKLPEAEFLAAQYWDQALLATLHSMDTNLVAPLAGRAADLLLRRIESTNDLSFSFTARNWSEALQAVTALMEKEMAAAAAARAAEALIGVLGRATNREAYEIREARRPLAQFLELAAAKLDSDAAARLSQVAVAELKVPRDVYSLEDWTRLLSQSLEQTEPALAATLASDAVEVWLQKIEADPNRRLGDQTSNWLSLLLLKMPPAEVASRGGRLIALRVNPTGTNSFSMDAVSDALPAFLAAMSPHDKLAQAVRLLALVKDVPEQDYGRQRTLNGLLKTFALSLESPEAVKLGQPFVELLELRANNFDRDAQETLAGLTGHMRQEELTAYCQWLADHLESQARSNYWRLDITGGVLARALGKLESKELASTLAARAGGVLSAEISRHPGYVASALAEALAAVVVRLEDHATRSNIVAPAVESLIGEMQRGWTNYSGLTAAQAVGSLLPVLGGKGGGEAAEMAARLTIAQLTEALPRDSGSQAENIAGILAPLPGLVNDHRVAADLAQQGANLVLRLMAERAKTNTYSVATLGLALAKLLPQLDGAVATNAATQCLRFLAEAAPRQLKNYYPDPLDVMTNLATRADPTTVAAVASQYAHSLIGSMKDSEVGTFGAFAFGEAAGTLQRLMALMDPRIASQIAEAGVTVLTEKVMTLAPDDQYGAGDLIRSAVLLQNHVEAKRAPSVTSTNAALLLARIRTEKGAHEIRVQDMPTLLAALTSKIKGAKHAHHWVLLQLMQEPPAYVSGVPRAETERGKLLASLCIQLNPDELTQVLKWPFCVDDAERIVLLELERQTKSTQSFRGDLWKFVAQARSLGITNLDTPAVRPRAEAALLDLASPGLTLEKGLNP